MIQHPHPKKPPGNQPYQRPRELWISIAQPSANRETSITFHCSACPKDAQPDSGKVLLKAEIEDLLARDEDGLARPTKTTG